jgi:hypothetical protein
MRCSILELVEYSFCGMAKSTTGLISWKYDNKVTQDNDMGLSWCDQWPISWGGLYSNECVILKDWVIGASLSNEKVAVIVQTITKTCTIPVLILWAFPSCIYLKNARLWWHNALAEIVLDAVGEYGFHVEERRQKWVATWEICTMTLVGVGIVYVRSVCGEGEGGGEECDLGRNLGITSVKVKWNCGVFPC